MEKVLVLFHHIHHEKDGHKVHHCGGDHAGMNYNIHHCQCGKHCIDKQLATGHDFDGREIEVKFIEVCPDGGWHIESGVF